MNSDIRNILPNCKYKSFLEAIVNQPVVFARYAYQARKEFEAMSVPLIRFIEREAILLRQLEGADNEILELKRKLKAIQDIIISQEHLE